MPKGTMTGGGLEPIKNCYIVIPNYPKITLNNLPDISDSKQAQYNDEPIIGRASTLKTYSHSAARQIGMGLHFFVTRPEDVYKNLQDLWALESAVYPREDAIAPYIPPPVCRLRCGWLLGDKDVCAILLSYSVKFDTQVAWDSITFTPFKFDVDTNWEVVYSSKSLPGQERIMLHGQ